VKTGYFAKHGNLAGAVAISLSVPKFYQGPRCQILCPRWDMMKMSKDDYDVQYDCILKKLNPKKVFDELLSLGKGEEPILLCWERPNTWCHRRRVAEWFEEALGTEVSEYGFHRIDVIPYAETVYISK
jgi:hypothetical protein